LTNFIDNQGIDLFALTLFDELYQGLINIKSDIYLKICGFKEKFTFYLFFFANLE